MGKGGFSSSESAQGAKVKIRGIYATSLTKLLWEAGFQIVQPSELIQARLGLPPRNDPPQVTVCDRENRHGVVIQGLRSPVEEVVACLQASLPGALFFPRPAPSGWEKLAQLGAAWVGEFPRPVKEELDQIRAGCAPTLPGHHQLKVVAPERVDQLEASAAPEKFPQLAKQLWKELVWDRLSLGQPITVEHVKAGGGGFRWRGTLARWAPGQQLVLKRSFRPGGRYDSLDVPKREGDFGLVELPLEGWWAKRSYFRADGQPIGELYDIHTPLEVYPGRVRYVDLELDVVCLPNGEVFLVDEGELKKKERLGLLPPTLARRAREEAQRLLSLLTGGGG